MNSNVDDQDLERLKQKFNNGIDTRENILDVGFDFPRIDSGTFSFLLDGKDNAHKRALFVIKYLKSDAGLLPYERDLLNLIDISYLFKMPKLEIKNLIGAVNDKYFNDFYSKMQDKKLQCETIDTSGKEESEVEKCYLILHSLNKYLHQYHNIIRHAH